MLSRKRGRVAVGVAGLLVAGILGAGPAVADQAQDDAYLQGVRDIFPDRTNWHPDKVIANAHKVCELLGGGEPFDSVVSDLAQANHGASLDQVRREVQLAKSTYCP
ncbi:DUF732 domain-containing protein [Candidatus Mycobacterium wuenschmannii]|uniref:DUF732 domain-containing protein n=1 Tax=Candidatus Mycobacterium wuenschmannii TaxID=3027808 RepID=A0ABY8VQD3_9MYCO|nr:DUF732 domain-containing protein [Candidatus Mycobacterium wuenschmannii]WIM85850.1 DUF732 domain-containing protein [Candidatus Mycobacterium wuenschmannii]